MDKENVLVEDNYNLFVPIEDHDLMKSVSVDENGDYIVQGVMSTDDTDEEDDAITPEGMDCSYFLEKGWVKYEHGKNPNQFIGEPLEVKVGRFKHPTLLKSVNGIFVKARLFANREMTKQAIEAMTDLQKSHTKRRMGWSIEGNVAERDEKTGKIVKSILRNVVLTMNPVNTTTWAELAKSFAKGHELTIDTDEPIAKSMGVAEVAEVTPQSLEGASKKKKDPQQAWIDAFRETVQKALIEKSFRSDFIHSPEMADLVTYTEAINKGLDLETAEELANYVAERHDILKSLVINFGGEKMSKSTKNSLASFLDADLEELKKSMDIDNDEDDFDKDEDEDEELEKGFEEGADQDEDEDEDEDIQKSIDDEDEEEEEEEEGDEEGDEEMEKSFGGSTLRKSLTEDHGKAFEVSDFLTAIADEIGFGMEGMEKSITSVKKSQNAVVGAIGGLVDLMKSMKDEIIELRSNNEELSKSFGDVMSRPVGRKGVVNQREVQTLTKSIATGNGPAQPLSRAEVGAVLEKSFDAGEITGSVITRFEGGVPLNQLNLPASVKQSIGLN